MLDRAVPNLPSRDLAATAEFYGRFGFEEVYRSDDWLVLCRGPLQLEFFPLPQLDPFRSDFMCSIRVADLDALYQAIRAAGVPEVPVGFPRLVPIAEQDWGRRAGFLVDPDGTQFHLIEDPEPGADPA